MATRVQVVLDCHDPQALAAFWADALRYEREDHTTVIEGLTTAGRLRPEEVVEVEGGKAFRDLAACRDAAGVGPRLLLQRVPEDKAGKNRMHIDLHVGEDAAAAEVERLTGLGARVLWTIADRGPLTTTMADPEGNEFCVS
ncbi:MAG: VOC family protein [Actinomycetes bacterium]